MTDDEAKYSVIKNQLKNIINKKIIGDVCDSNIGMSHEDILNTINDVVFRCHIIITHTYNFIKLYFIHLYDNDLDFPLIDHNFVYLVMNIISVRNDNRGRKPSKETDKIIKSLEEFYEKYYKKVVGDNHLVSNDKLSYILKNYEAVDIAKNIDTNIKEHFPAHLRKYVNDYFNVKTKIYNVYQNKQLSVKEKDQKVKEIKTKYNKVKDDLLSIDKVYTSHENFHDWISDTRNKFLPKKVFHENGIFYDVCIEPQKYLKSMITLNRAIQDLSDTEGKNYKLFNALPLRTDNISKYITIDTCALISIFCCYGKDNYLKNVTQYKDQIWSSIFRTNSKQMKRSSYAFNYMIKTDGVGCSILFEKHEKQFFRVLPFDYVEEKVVKKKFTKDKKKKSTENVINNKYDYKYIEDTILTDQLRSMRIVTIDPGHRDLITCISKDDTTNFDISDISNNKVKLKKHKINNTFKYSRKQRNAETKKVKYNRIRNYIKSKEKYIAECDEKLSKYNSKSFRYKDFSDYLIEKYSFESKYIEHYQKKIYRKLNINTFINTQKSEEKVIKNFRAKYGNSSDVLIIFGDYDKKETMKGSEPHICKRLKKLFVDHGYKLLLVNEYNTSKKCHKCGSDTELFKMALGKKQPNGEQKSDNLLWELKRCKASNCLTIHQRDHNACCNMLKIVDSVMEGKGRPEELTRIETISKKKQTTKKSGSKKPKQQVNKRSLKKMVKKPKQQVNKRSLKKMVKKPLNQISSRKPNRGNPNIYRVIKV